MGYLRSEEEAEMMIEEMKRKTKGKYITQGVSLNKDSERQMELLKFALMYSNTFSGLVKELLADKFDNENMRGNNKRGNSFSSNNYDNDDNNHNNINMSTVENGSNNTNLKEEENKPTETKNVGNFLL